MESSFIILSVIGDVETIFPKIQRAHPVHHNPLGKYFEMSNLILEKQNYQL
jgi:hypothetical protein